MQIKTTLSFYLTPGRMAKITNTSDSSCCQGCWSWGTLFYLCWDCKLYSLYGNQHGSSSENLKLIYLKMQLFYSWTSTQRTQRRWIKDMRRTWPTESGLIQPSRDWAASTWPAWISTRSSVLQLLGWYFVKVSVSMALWQALRPHFFLLSYLVQL